MTYKSLMATKRKSDVMGLPPASASKLEEHPSQQLGPIFEKTRVSEVRIRQVRE